MNTDPTAAKFAPLFEQATAAPNFDLETVDIVRQLQAWDQQYGIEIDAVEADGLTVVFKTLPDTLSPLAQEIYEFCPDVIDQHFGCFDDLLESLDEPELSPELAELIQGIDFNRDDFGLKLLEKSLTMTQSVGLWWD